MCVEDSRVVVMEVCGGGSVGVLMRFVWRSLHVWMGVLGVGVRRACLLKNPGEPKIALL